MTRRIDRSLVATLGVLCLGLVACDAPPPQLATLEPGEELPGGATTNTLMFGVNAFSLPAANISDDNESLFFAGNSLFNQVWIEATASVESRDGLGPLFNATSCAGCHFKDGRGRPPIEDGEEFASMLLRLSIDGEDPTGGPAPDPVYGGQLQPHGIANVAGEGTPTITYETVSGQFGDGEPYSLLKPTYHIGEVAYGPMAPGVMISPRVAPAVYGLGLLAAIDEARLQALADPDDADGDGVSGRLNRVWDVVAKTTTVGRFGWKAEQPSVKQQSAGAFLGDMGITSSLAPDQDCTDAQTDCKVAKSGGAPEADDDQLHRIDTYGRLLAVPARTQYADEVVLRGKHLFGDAGCASCHVPSHTTSSDVDLAELRDQPIWPYTDLLLHDMGDGLSDGRPVFEATGNEWRTPPLWGLRLYRVVNGHDRLLHDGRARGVAEAILWHGGEGEASREEFRTLPAGDREALITFVESL